MSRTNRAAIGAGLGGLCGLAVALVVSVGSAMSLALAGGVLFGLDGPLTIVPPWTAAFGSLAVASIVGLLLLVSRLCGGPARQSFWLALTVLVATAFIASAFLGADAILPSRTEGTTWVVAQLSRSPLSAFVMIFGAFQLISRPSREQIASE